MKVIGTKNYSHFERNFYSIESFAKEKFLFNDYTPSLNYDLTSLIY